MSAHVIALADPKKGECAASFYMRDRAARRALIEKAIAANPDLGETSVIIGLLTKTCGPLVPGPPALTTR